MRIEKGVITDRNLENLTPEKVIGLKRFLVTRIVNLTTRLKNVVAATELQLINQSIEDYSKILKELDEIEAAKRKTGDIHELKTLPEYFEAVKSGVKSFEVRKNDRDFKVNDVLNLKEYDQLSGYTGNEIHFKITYILNDPEYVKEGYVILAISFLEEELKCI